MPISLGTTNLRSYASPGRAEAFARELRSRFPAAEFEVRTSPFASYPFRYLIICTRDAEGRVVERGAWVSR